MAKIRNIETVGKIELRRNINSAKELKLRAKIYLLDEKIRNLQKKRDEIENKRWRLSEKCAGATGTLRTLREIENVEKVGSTEEGYLAVLVNGKWHTVGRENTEGFISDAPIVLREVA